MSFPIEIWLQILSNKHPVEVLRLCRTNQIFASICEDRGFWRRSLQRYLDLGPYIYDSFFTYPLYQNAGGNIVARDVILSINNRDEQRLLRWAILTDFTTLIVYLYQNNRLLPMKQIISLALQYNRPKVVTDLLESVETNQLSGFIILAIRARNLPIFKILMREEQERGGQSIQHLTNYAEIASEELAYAQSKLSENEVTNAQNIVDYLDDELTSRL